MAKMTTPVVVSEDKERHVAMQTGDVFDVSVIPVSSDKKNLIETDDEGLLVTATGLVSAQANNPLVNNIDGKLFVKTPDMVAAGEKVISVADNKMSITLSLRYNSGNSTLDLLGVGGAVVSHLQLPIVPGLPVVAEILRDITPPGGSLPKGTYLHLRFVLADGTTSDSYVNVSDLVDIYEAGNGIAIGNNTVSVKVNPGKGIVTSPDGVAVSLADLLLPNDKVLTASSNKLTSTVMLSADKVNGRLLLTGKNSELISQVAFSDMVSPSALVKPGGGLVASSAGLEVSCIGITPCITSVLGSLVQAGTGLTLTNGQLSVDFNSLPPEKIYQLVQAMVQDGGGLAVDSSGKLYVDFSTMPTDKFEALLKSLRLPIWLTAPKTWYVNQSHANASDTLDDGRGETLNKPFKTIDACAKYVAENYNVVNFTATINVVDGIYGPLSLGEFSRTTGYIHIVGQGPNTIIRRTNLGACVSVVGGSWRLTSLGMEHSMDYTGVTEKINNYAGGVFCTGGSCNCYGINMAMTQTGANASGRAKTYVGYLTRAGASLGLFPGEKQNRLTVNFADTDTINRYAFAAEGGDLTFGALADEDLLGNMICSGAFTTFCRSLARGYVARSQSQTNKLYFSGNCTGKRYECGTGGAIATGGSGADYFPGDVAGTVDADTYSWYK